MSHDHNHDHEERELITLVDEQGNETLFEILLTIDGKEEFGKNYVLLVPVNAEEDEDGQVEIQAYSFIENEDGTEGELQPIPEDSEDEWNHDWRSLQQLYGGVKTSSGLFLAQLFEIKKELVSRGRFYPYAKNKDRK